MLPLFNQNTNWTWTYGVQKSLTDFSNMINDMLFYFLALASKDQGYSYQGYGKADLLHDPQKIEVWIKNLKYPFWNIQMQSTNPEPLPSLILVSSTCTQTRGTCTWGPAHLECKWKPGLSRTTHCSDEQGARVCACEFPPLQILMLWHLIKIDCVWCNNCKHKNGPFQISHICSTCAFER